MWPLGRETLQNEHVTLILLRALPESEDKAWAPSRIFAICEAQPRGLLGYRRIGICDLRIGYSENLYYGGHIGYRVMEKHRGHHAALHASSILLQKAREEGMPYVIITCNPDNIPSRKTLARLAKEAGGELLRIVDLPPYNEMYQDGERQKCIFFFPLKEGQEAPQTPPRRDQTGGV